MRNRSIFIGLIAVFSLYPVRAADTLSEALQKGLLAEEAHQDLPAAIQNYQAVLAQFNDQRKIAATAAFRLGECYRKLGKTDQALAQFQRVVRDFPDQAALVNLSQKYLAEAGRTATPVSPAASPFETVVDPAQVKLLREEIALVEEQLKEARKRFEVGQAASEEIIQTERELIPLQRKLPENADPEKQEALIRNEIQLVEQLLAAAQQRVQVGRASPTDLISLKRDLLSLQRELLAVQEAAKHGFQPPLNTIGRRVIVRRAEGSPSLSEEEAKEIQRLRDIIKNSPDLVNALQGSVTGVAPLQDAAAKGQLAAARFLLENHADINVGEGRGAGTPLHYAAVNGHKSMVELLLDHGATVDARDLHGYTPLYVAASKGFQAVAEVLLDRGADVNARTDDNSTPLHAAVAQRQVRMVEWLLEHKADVDAQDGRENATALICAVRNRDAKIVELLLGHNANPNLKTKEGHTALSLSLSLSMRIDVETRPITRMLLEHGADPNLEAQFSIGVPGGGRQNVTTTPLVYAVHVEDTDLVEQLLTRGAEIDQRDNLGRTALYWAVLQEKAPLVDLLLAKGANPNVADSGGYTPLIALLKNWSPTASPPAGTGLSYEFQARYGITPRTLLRTPSSSARLTAVQKSILDALLARKADVNHAASDGLTPLLLALVIGDLEVVRALVEHGADVQKATEVGVTPLLDAARLGNSDALKLFLDKGADVNQKAIHGYTALHVTANLGDTNMMQILLQKGADVNLQDDDGNTPLHYAAFQGQIDAVKMLLEHGAKLDVADRLGITPVEAASETALLSGEPPLYASIPRFGRPRGPGFGRHLNDTQRAVRDLLRQRADKPARD